MHSDDSLGADLAWDRAELGVGLAVPLRRDVLWLTLAGGSDLNGRLPVDRYFALGGPGSFPGLELGEKRVAGYWTASTGYRWKFKDTMSIRGQALYAGISLEAGATYRDALSEFDGGNNYRTDIYGGSIYLTGRTGRPAHPGRRRHQHGFVECMARRRPADRSRHDPRERHLPLGRHLDQSGLHVAPRTEHRFGLEEFLEPERAPLATESGLLVAAERAAERRDLHH